MKIKEKISLLLIASTVAGMMSLGIANAASGVKFTDVSSTDPYYKAINWLTLNGVVQGYGDGTFRPNNPVNRAEMLKMIFLADGNEKNADTAMGTAAMFPDTPKTEWYAKYVALARQRGTVQGYPDGYFRPGNNINKAEAYKIVMKEFYNDTTMQYAVTHGNLPNSGSIASDVKSTDWFAVYVNFAALKNFYDAGSYTHATSGNPFYPAQNLTRGQLAQLIYRAKAVSDNFPNDIQEQSSIFGDTIIPFNVSLYNYTFAESSGTPNFTITDDAHPNALIGYATKYPQSLLISSGDVQDMLKFFAGSNHDMLDISIEVKPNPDKLSIQDFYSQPLEKVNYYNTSTSHDDLLVNSDPAVWFHKVNTGVATPDEVVVIQFANAIAEITDHQSRHESDGVFNYMVRNFFFKNFAV